ncbi:MAG TPA: hypothetical protein VFQ63_01355 [Patescibacteria group bacterium]|nr:hypothetical protein [Patescibacteria group bacterium]
MITIDDFAKVEIRIGTVLQATKVLDADRLIQLIFDFGDLSDPDSAEITRLPELVEKYPGRDVRQIMSAIAPFIEDPSTLVGKQIAVCINLEPRSFRGYQSQGMIMATGDNAETLSFMVPEKKVEPGSKIH